MSQEPRVRFMEVAASREPLPVRPCHRCGHDMRDPGDLTRAVIGAQFVIYETAAWAATRHKPGVYEICWSCYLEAFGIKPNKKTVPVPAPSWPMGPLDDQMRP